MNRDELDRMLSRNEEIVPSSGFTAAVMGAVRETAAIPAAIPFPWRRALPIIAAALLSFTAVIAVSISQWGKEDSLSAGWSMPPALNVGLQAALQFGGHWIVLAAVITFVCVRISLRMAGTRN